MWYCLIGQVYVLISLTMILYFRQVRFSDTVADGGWYSYSHGAHYHLWPGNLRNDHAETLPFTEHARKTCEHFEAWTTCATLKERVDCHRPSRPHLDLWIPNDHPDTWWWQRGVRLGHRIHYLELLTRSFPVHIVRSVERESTSQLGTTLGEMLPVQGEEGFDQQGRPKVTPDEEPVSIFQWK